MIIWLNGPFGIGKTTTAQALVRHLPGALLFDPQPFGAALRTSVATVETAPDFQDLRAWPMLRAGTARVLRSTCGCSLVMPLTVWRRPTAEAVLVGLRNVDCSGTRLQVAKHSSTNSGLRVIAGNVPPDRCHQT